MKAAVISDIHSNVFALEAVLKAIDQENIDRIFVLGDIFGYYPWAVETYDILSDRPCVFIKGNHDHLVETCDERVSTPWYFDLVVHNRHELVTRRPEALSWLSKMGFSQRITLDHLEVNLIHGSPLDPANGRIYPDYFEKLSADEMRLLSWMPAGNEIVLLGHTHYPFCFRTTKNGIVANPGSIGQPRDGNPMPSWGILDSSSSAFYLRRSDYDYMHVIEILNSSNWNARATKALAKNYIGTLKY